MPIAFVTGAGVRIGRATACALAAAGYDLALHANASLAPLQALRTELEALGRTIHLFQADLSQEQSLDNLALQLKSQYTHLDVVVHNAAIFERVPFQNISREQYRKMLAINLDAPFFLTQALLPLLHAAPAPSVIHITDVGGERAMSQYSHYGVSKAGLIMLTRQLAVELAPHIRVNAISPGAIAFPADFSPEQQLAHLRRVPMGREGSVEDIARTVVFLVKDAPYITGQILAVDGGRSSWL